MIIPIVFGKGRSLFEDLRNRLSFTLLRVRQFDSGNVLAHLSSVPTVMTTASGLKAPSIASRKESKGSGPWHPTHPAIRDARLPTSGLLR